MTGRHLLVFATQLEAQATIEVLRAQNAGGGIWRFPQGELLVTGMGIMHATVALCRHLGASPPFDALWHLGFAAALKNQRIGTLFEVGRVCRANPWGRSDLKTREFFAACFPLLYLDTSEAGSTLLTVDAPLHHAGKRKMLSALADLVDMEGYGVVSAARKFGVPARSIKVASDSAQAGGRRELQRRAAEFSQSLAHWMEQQLPQC